ncbi:hypothetical protein GJ496_009181 [Pomphorhynchus laevis]|nr:hypothetical protein GJ496_009181 [Pomphorhynchus laevis]
MTHFIDWHNQRPLSQSMNMNIINKVNILSLYRTPEASKMNEILSMLAFSRLDNVNHDNAISKLLRVYQFFLRYMMFCQDTLVYYNSDSQSRKLIAEKCSMCDKKFKNRFFLELHVKRRHSSIANCHEPSLHSHNLYRDNPVSVVDRELLTLHREMVSVCRRLCEIIDTKTNCTTVSKKSSDNVNNRRKNVVRPRSTEDEQSYSTIFAAENNSIECEHHVDKSKSFNCNSQSKHVQCAMHVKSNSKLNDPACANKSCQTCNMQTSSAKCSNSVSAGTGSSRILNTDVFGKLTISDQVSKPTIVDKEVNTDQILKSDVCTQFCDIVEHSSVNNNLNVDGRPKEFKDINQQNNVVIDLEIKEPITDLCQNAVYNRYNCSPSNSTIDPQSIMPKENINVLNTPQSEKILADNESSCLETKHSIEDDDKSRLDIDDFLKVSEKCLDGYTMVDITPMALNRNLNKLMTLSSRETEIKRRFHSRIVPVLKSFNDNNDVKNRKPSELSQSQIKKNFSLVMNTLTGSLSKDEQRRDIYSSISTCSSSDLCSEKIISKSSEHASTNSDSLEFIDDSSFKPMARVVRSALNPGKRHVLSMRSRVFRKLGKRFTNR